MKVLTRTRTVGGSLVVTIPIEIVKTEMLREDDIVELEVKKKRTDFFGVLRGIGSFEEDDKLRGQFDE